MKKASLVTLFSMIMAGIAYAGTQAGQTQMGFMLPQPCTILICTAGMVFTRFLTKRIP